MEYHVAKNGNDLYDGSALMPFLTISRAAKVADAGDTVIVHQGVYREWVKPMNGGLSTLKPVTYMAAPGEKAVIKGSEHINTWTQVKDSVWKAVIPNEIFGDYNPYAEEIWGDWLEYPSDRRLHAGDVYLNGKSFYEAKSLDEVQNPKIRTKGANPPWLIDSELILYPEDTLYLWYAEVDNKNTVIYGNFQGSNPNEEYVEINVRKCCFYPDKAGINYIIVKGFEMAQAACPWAPPTAEQPGLIGAHWSRGWIIEDNIIHDAKCSGISIGKEISTGHNLSSKYKTKPGYQYQMEAVFRGKQIGWDKENIGSHIIRNNKIYDCGQNGIVGHMGCIFSSIYGNHIYNIGIKHEFFGWEIAGIKLHAAIDVQIYENNIHHCTLGTWLDWQAQGTRISRNLYYANNRDLMIEVTHGPHIIDNNIFASGYNLENVAQGGAYIHNLFCGIIRRSAVLNRATPYHFPHSTDVAGTTFVYSGDDRFYQNIFVGDGNLINDHTIPHHGTSGYNDSTTSMEEYSNSVREQGIGDVEMFEAVRQPAYIDCNCYFNNASAFSKENNKYIDESNPNAKVYEKDGATYLEINLDKDSINIPCIIIDTKTLGYPRIVEEPFENPDGSPIIFNKDYLGNPRSLCPFPGPIENLKNGCNLIKVWKENIKE